MEPFNLVSEAIIFIAIFYVIIIVPCYFVTVIGRDMMDQMGRFPTKTALIQIKSFFKLVIVEIAAFMFLTSFYRIFAD